jgi:dihydroneopterin aldolase
VEASKHYLVESLATEIARICCVEFHAQKSTVRIEKPNAIRFAASVGVEITRTAEDLC